jgi:hypothetical protein
MKKKRLRANGLLILMGIFLAVVGCSKSSSSSNDPIINNSVKTTGSLAVSTLTSSAGGAYAPNNVVAIWVESNSGTFVKSLLVYAATRKYDLTNWTSNSSSNTTDAITGATQSSHAVRTCTWNGTNTSGTVVGDGVYKVCMELTDKEGTGNFSSFTFTKGTTVDTQTPSNASSFSNISIVWTPQ